MTGFFEPVWSESDYINLDYEDRPGTQYPHTGFENLTTIPIDTDLVSMGVASVGLPAVFENLAQEFGFHKWITAVNRYEPGTVLPWHRDTYARFRKNFSVDSAQEIHRIIVFLHDPKPGHQLWIDEEFCTGPAGSWFSWTDQTPHMAANLGLTNRYILQITGVYADDTP